MHYEWQEGDVATAVRWTEQALALCQSWSPARAQIVQPELEHRLARLQGKLAE